MVDGGVNGVGIRLGLECVYMGLGYICSWAFFDIWVTFCIRSCFMLFYVKLNNYLIIYFYFLYILAYPRILIFLKNSVSEYRRIAYRYPYPGNIREGANTTEIKTDPIMGSPLEREQQNQAP